MPFPQPHQHPHYPRPSLPHRPFPNQGGHRPGPVSFPEVPGNRPPASTDDIRKFLESKHQERFSKLSESEQTEFINLVHGTQSGGRAFPPMVDLLSSGRLMEKDSNGNTVLHHMNTMSNQDMPQGLNRTDTLRHMAHVINEPSNFTQDRVGTCTVTSVGREHLRKNPADFARVMAGLTSESGQATTARGDKINRQQASLSYTDGSGRTSVERIYQDALMDFGNGELSYNPHRDRHEAAGEPFNGTDGRGRSGLVPKQTRRVVESVLDRDVNIVNFGENRNSSWARSDFRSDLQEYTNSDQQMSVGMRWKTGGHRVNVSHIKDGYVYLDNPHGARERAEGDPPREIYAGAKPGQFRMKEDDFYNHLNNYQSLDRGFLGGLFT